MIDIKEIKLDPSWQNIVSEEFHKPYMEELKSFLLKEIQDGQVIYPKGNKIFNAMNITAFNNVRVVILGQDPYHGENQAHGLSFSVRDVVKFPPSLRNIYKEIALEYDCPMPKSGNLSHWAEQGVLLLNATLTVREAQAGSHHNKGWEEFTDAIIRSINDNRENVVFLLWGAYAQKKGSFIDQNKHLVLTAPHPSPLSAHRGFFGCGHFRKANEYLVSQGKKPISWVT